MEILLRNEMGANAPLGQGGADGAPADLIVRDDPVVGVVNLRREAQGDWIAEITITVRRQDGDIDLVGYVVQAIPTGESEALAFLTKQWPHLRIAFEETRHGLSLKAATQPFDQAKVSSLAALHMTQHELDAVGDEGVLPKTARMWRLLQQFGSFRPAEVIADFLGEKVPTIHARINLSRSRGLIPPTARSKKKDK